MLSLANFLTRFFFYPRFQMQMYALVLEAPKEIKEKYHFIANFFAAIAFCHLYI